MNTIYHSALLMLFLAIAGVLPAQEMEPEVGHPPAPFATFSVLDRLEEVRAITDPETLFGLGMNDPDLRVALEAVNRLDDQALLGRLAWEAPRKAVRADAIRRLTDAAEIEKLARGGDWYLRDLAVAQIKEPELLAEVARTDPDPVVREDAAKRLKDALVLRDIAARDPEPRVREAAAWSIRDPETLASIVRTSDDRGVRKAALGALTDKYLLLAIARETADAEFREQALGKIGDPALVQAVAMGTDPPAVRILAVRCLNDPEIFRALAIRSQDDGEVRAAAVGRLEDATLLARLAKPDQPLSVRLAAIGQIKDPALLARLAEGSDPHEVRLAAVGRLSDAKVLARLALQEKDEVLRARATGRLNDRALLARILKEDPSPTVRREAVARVGLPQALKDALADSDDAVRARAILEIPEDTALFQESALKDPSPLVRKNAAGRLSDPVLLDRIIRQDPSTSVRAAAMGRLTDAKTLEAYLLGGPDWILRILAAAKITDTGLLERAAASDPDENVRDAARDRLYTLEVLEKVADPALRDALWKASVAPPVRLRRSDLEPADAARRPAVGAILAQGDPAALRLALSGVEPEIRRAAAFRLLELDGQPTDPRAVRLYLALSDSAMEKQFGPLRLALTIQTSEQRYALERPGGGYPPDRGRVITERWRVRVFKADGALIAEKEYLGAKGKKAQAFDKRYPLIDGSYLLYNAARINYVEICREVLKSADRELLELLARSRDPYLRTAADELLHP